jgi:tetratricopeptide (TPR) repeat protein
MVGDRPPLKFDVFLCHKTVDKPAVQRVAAKLKEMGLKPWLDVEELRPGEPWQPLIEEQIISIGAAAIFIGADGVGDWQSQEARSFLQQYNDRKCRVIPVILENAPAGTELSPFLRNFGWVDFRMSEPEPFGQLYWGIKGEKYTKKPDAPTQQRVFGAEQIRQVPLWVGRDVLLTELKDDLLERRRKVLVLVGQGGIGKTSLAVKLLEACGVSSGVLSEDCVFGRVLYVKVQEGMSFDGVMAQLGRGLGLELDGLLSGQMIDRVIGALQGQRHLVVLDNLEDVLRSGKAVEREWGELLWALVERQHQGQVIITSREMPGDLADPRDASGIPNRLVVRVKRIEGIGEDASVQLLRDVGLRDSEADLRWVAQRVDGQVQVLVLLAKWAEKPGMLRKRPELVTADAKPILRVQVARQSEAGQALLKRMGVLRVGIDLEGLTFLRLYQEDGAEFGRFARAAAIEEPVAFLPEETEQTETLVKALVSCSLVQEQYDEERCVDSFSLHRVMVEFMQAEYASELPTLISAVYSFYKSGCALENPKTLEDLRPVLEAQHFAFQLGNYSEAQDLIYKLEKYLQLWGHWLLLKQLCEQILDRINEPSLPYILARLGSHERDWGNWDAAETYYRAGLKLAEKHQDRGVIANLTGQLGSIERNRGNWDAAERLYRQYLQMMEELGDRSGMASSWGVLGDIERNRGNWDAAERLYRQYLQMMEELGDRSGMASSWGVLGDIERNRGNWDAAERLYRQSLQLQEELGDRSGMATSIGCLGENELGRGNLEQAEILLKDALSQMEALGMTWHIAETNYDLAQLYRQQQNPTLAQHHYTTAHQLFTQLGAQKDIEKIEQEWNL